MEHPIVIYADFESINQQVDIQVPSTPQNSQEPPASQNSQESPAPQNSQETPAPQHSGTHIKTKHICSGYSYTVVSKHCQNKVVTYRGVDAGKHFLESLMEEEIRISKWLKEIENKEHNLSADEERQWQAETECYICKDKFYKGCKPPASKKKQLKNI